MKLLFSGFDPFGRHATNPSWDALELAASEGWFSGAGAQIVAVRLPCVYSTAFEALDQAFRRHRPGAVVACGVHGGLSGRDAATIYLERFAHNRDGANLPDNEGLVRNDAPILPGAAERLETALPLQWLHGRLREQGFATEISEDAGRYLCNHLFFRALHAYKGKALCGFVHVPPADEEGAVLATTARALARLAHSVAEHIRNDGARNSQ